MTPSNSSAAWFSRRKVIIFMVLISLIGFLFIIKEKYFYRADILKPMNTQAVHNPATYNKIQVHIKETKASIWGYFGLGSKDEKPVEKKLPIWDVWMAEHSTFYPIGDIYDICDNKTRTTIGKVVLEPNGDGGVKIVSYCNQTYAYDVTHATSKLRVSYKGSLLYEKEYDMCKVAPKLDTPYGCPIVKGSTIIIRDVATMPSYIPKGTYTIYAVVKDQDGIEIGCTHAEFKTGEADQ